MDLEDQQDLDQSPQQKWNNITEANHKAAKDALGQIGGKKCTNEEVMILTIKGTEGDWKGHKCFNKRSREEEPENITKC